MFGEHYPEPLEFTSTVQLKKQNLHIYSSCIIQLALANKPVLYGKLSAVIVKYKHIRFHKFWKDGWCVFDSIAAKGFTHANKNCKLVHFNMLL